MDNYQREHNDATRLRADADFYLDSLDKNLISGTSNNDTTITTLITKFSRLSIEELESYDLSISANLIHSLNQKILANWIGFNIALRSLKTYENTSFVHHYISVKLKPHSVFGLSYCAALDNYCYVQSKGEMAFNEYSQVVPNTN